MLRTILLAIAIIAMLAPSLQAASVTSPSQFVGETTVIDFSNGTSSFTNGPLSVGEGVTWSSTNSGSVIFYNSSYGLNSNGSWTSARNGYAGLNTSSGSMTFEFAEDIASVGGLLNYASSHGNPTISIFNRSGQLLESKTLSFSVSGNDQGFFHGFQRNESDIARLTLNNSYVVIDDLEFSSVGSTSNVNVSAVPETSTVMLLSLAVMLGVARRRFSV